MSFLRICLSLLLTLSLAPALAAGQLITVSTNNTPLDRKVLELISAEAFRRIGKDFKLISLPSERSLLAANKGEIDGEGLRVAGLSARYPDLVQVPESYTRISFVAFARNDAIEIDGWQSLQPHRVAFINGWKMFETNASQASVVNKVAKPEQLFKMLEQDRIDLALYTLADGQAYLSKHPMPTVNALSPSLKDVDLFLYLHERHRDLVPGLVEAIRAMKADGTYERLVSKALGS